MIDDYGRTEMYDRARTLGTRFCPHWRFLDILCSIHVLPQTCQAFIRPYPSRWGHDMLRLLRAFHQHMFYVPSTYVLRLINICSTFINISSTLHLRLIYEGSTSHLRGIDVSSTRDFEEKRKCVPSES